MRDEVATFDERHDRQGGHTRMQNEPIAFAELPLRMNGVCVLELAAREVLEPLVAVESSSVRAELSDPWPGFLGGRVDFDAVGPTPSRLGNDLVARVGACGHRRLDAP